MQKRIYNFEKIRGVDVTSSPINVASNRASRMVNMINEGGTNKKRHGWKDIAWFEDGEGKKLPINGIYRYVGEFGAEEKIVHAGTHFFRCDDSFNIFSSYSELKVSGAEISSSRSKGYLQDGKLWIVVSGQADGFLVYDGNVVQPVMNSMYAYIPTTSIGIMPRFSPTESVPGEKYRGERYQGVNLFNKRRINKLIGQDVLSWYVLDGKINLDEPYKISIEYNRGTEDDVQYAYVELNYGDGVNNSFALDEHGEKISELVEELRTKIVIENGSDGNGVVNIRFSCAPIVEGESNITIEYAAVYKSDIMISSSNTVSLAAGVDSLCLVNHGNIVYFSDVLYGHGYFPDNDYIGIGTEDKPVTAVMSFDSGIGVFKRDELYRVNVNVKIIDEEYLVRIEPSIAAIYHGPGCESEHCALQVNGDSLIYNGMGVNGVISSASKPVNMRSTNVNRELCAYNVTERKEAVAVSHEGRYYLFVADRVYIADTRFKTYESNRLDSGYEYEWWIWDSSAARCAYSFDGELYIGTSDGRIRVLSDGYADLEIVHISNQRSEMTYNGAEFYFDTEFSLKNGEQVEINGALEVVNVSVTGVEFEEVGGEELIRCSYQCDSEYPSIDLGAEVYLLFGDERIIGHIADCDFYEHALVIKRDAGDDFDASYAQGYVLAKPPRIYTVEHTNSGTALVNEWGEVATFAEYDNIGATVQRRKNVCCEMISGMIDFQKLHTKTLFKLAVTPSVDTAGEVEIGYETNLGRSDKSRLVGKAVSFDAFDFKNFVFDGAFAKTYVKRAFERNFNYITFRFASNSDGPFGIENAQAVYSVNNELRSDR